MKHLLSLSAGLLVSASLASALTFPEWQTEVFSAGELADPAISGANADPEGDGNQNLLEYAFGLNPHVSDQAASFPATASNGLSLTHPERVAASDLLYHFEESTPDLQNWITPNVTNRTVLSDDGVLRMVSVDNPNAPATFDRWFNRLHLFVSPGAVEDLFAPSRPTATLEVPLTVVLGWNDNTRIEDGFFIERRTGVSGAWTAIGTTPADTNTFEDINITGSTEYAYRISALQGPDASESSAEITITTPLDTDQDGIPDDMEATYNTDPLLFSSGNNGTSDGWWVSYGLDPYSDTITDTDGDGRSDAQEFLDGTDPLTIDSAPNAGAPAPLAPSGLALTTLESGHNELTWTNNSVANGVIVERTEDNANWQTVGVVPGTQTTFTDATVQPSTVYFYRVAAFN